MTRSILVDDDASQHDDLLARLRRLEQGIPEEPHWVGGTGEPDFQNSWVNYDAAGPPVGRAAFFYRDRGRVYLGGVIKSGTSGTLIFTLPDGYLPLLETNGTAMAVSASGGVAFVSINPVTGGVSVANGSTSAVTTFVFLEGVSFRHA